MTNKKKIDDKRLKELSDRYQKPREKRKLEEHEDGLYKGYAVGISLLTHVLVGVFAGYGIDKLFNTSPLFLLIFIFLGFAAGMWQIYKESEK